jgi:hypothetical protein
MTKSLWFLAAFVVVLGITFVPIAGADVLAPVAAVVLGVTAAWSAVHTPGHTLMDAVKASASAGAGAWLASFVAFVALGATLGTVPAIQEFIRNSEPYPEARVPYEWIPALTTVLAGLVGIGIGLVNLGLATVAGLITGLVISPERRSITSSIG